jgi:YHS domain-containing protein
MLGVALAVGALLAIGSVRGDDSAAKLTCPVSGKPATKDHAVDFDGGKVYFCCDNCPKAFEANPKKFAAKAHLQMLETGQLTQKACPLTGNPVNPDMSVMIDGQKVGLCCANCKKKLSAMSEDQKIKAVFTDISKGYDVAK